MRVTTLPLLGRHTFYREIQNNRPAPPHTRLSTLSQFSPKPSTMPTSFKSSLLVSMSFFTASCCFDR